MKKQAGIFLSIVLSVMLSCVRGEVNSAVDASMTKSQHATLSKRQIAEVLVDLTERTIQRAEHYPGDDLDSIFGDVSLLTKTSNLYLVTRPVYTMDSVTFMNFTVDKDLAQYIRRDDTRLGCILCNKNTVLSYGL